MIDWLVAQDRALYFLLSQDWRVTALDGVMVLITNKWNLVLPGVLVLGVWLARGRWREKLWLTLIGVALIALTDIGATAIKKMVERPRPCMEVAGTLLGCTDSPSFPSNHAANFFAFATYLAFVAPGARWVWFPFAVMVAYSRVHVGVHYPLDVLAGSLFGAAMGTIGAGLAFLQGLTGAGSRARLPDSTRAASALAGCAASAPASDRDNARARAAGRAVSCSDTTGPG
jgi:undecaprenyl-diphosphatase